LMLLSPRRPCMPCLIVALHSRSCWWNTMKVFAMFRLIPDPYERRCSYWFFSTRPHYRGAHYWGCPITWEAYHF
jgi:hypothetical protein